MTEKQRNNDVDIIRMIALVGICVVNVPFMALPPETMLITPDNWYDKLGAFAVEGLFQLKFFLLFSFIFGWGMAIQAQSAERAGQNFARRYFRRMLGLAIIGIAHAFLVFNGDILLIYALLGVLLWLIKDLSPSALIRFAAAMIPLSLLCLSFLAVVMDAVQQSGLISLSAVGQNLGGDFVAATNARITDWPVTLLFLLFLQGPLALGAFACGLATAKSDFFAPDSPVFKRLGRAVPVLLLIAIPSNLLYATTMSGILPGNNELLDFIGFLSIAVGGPALSAVYLYLAIRLSRVVRMPTTLVLAGRNSLSTYVLQGILAGLVFGAYGLGYFNQFGLIALIPIAVTLALVAMVLVGVYAKQFGRGPLEPLLRLISG